ncbi:hypothetical protein CEXT_419981 [Caerostris extrusa]|uniref:Uncharacterized protein n=1 Tax=Caerostris extrusa TaxID=172846 RepID=A0AAV4XG85_CAEEX|nr:hypothetical protein CEXT_419981 [Caerostris extrusa]
MLRDRQCVGRKVEVLYAGSARMVEAETVEFICALEERQYEWSGLFLCHCSARMVETEMVRVHLALEEKTVW